LGSMDTSIPGGRLPMAKANPGRFELDGGEAPRWGGHPFTPTKSIDPKAQPSCWLCPVGSWREAQLVGRLPGSWGWSCTTHQEDGFGCSMGCREAVPHKPAAPGSPAAQLGQPGAWLHHPAASKNRSLTQQQKRGAARRCSGSFLCSPRFS